MRARVARTLRRAARTARSLDRIGAFRAVAMAAVRRFNRGTFRRLARDPAVAAVYSRGSLVRGPFYPLSSDVDLALVLRAARANDAASWRRFLAVLRSERWRNPSLRDWWQHLILDRELPIVREHWEIFATDEWRDARGEAPFLDAPAADRARLVRAHWAQQCAWSASAVQALVHPAAPFHDLNAGLRKCAFLASRLRAIATWDGAPLRPAVLFELRRLHASAFDAEYRAPPANDADRAAALAAMLAELAASARAVRATLHAGTTTADGLAGWSSRDACPAAIAELGELPGCAGLLCGDRTLHVAIAADLDAPRLARLLAHLRRSGAARSRLAHLVPAAAIDLWPLPLDAGPPVQQAGAANPSLPGATGEGGSEVATARQLMLFDSLFLPSAARLALTFADRDVRLARVAANLARAVALYADGRRCASFADVVAASRQPPTRLGDLGTEIAALGSAPAAGDRDLTDRRFALCAELSRRLYTALAAAAEPPLATLSASAPPAGSFDA